MESLLPDYSLWRHKYARACIIMYFLIIALEVAIFFLLKSNNMILQSIPEYMRNYFFNPIIKNTMVGVASVIVIKVAKSDRIKNAVPVVALTCMFGNVAVVHNVFFVTLMIFVVPILMCIVFGDNKLLWVITIISMFFVCYVVYHCYKGDTSSWNNPYFLPCVLIAIVGIFACRGVAATLINLLNMQNEKLLHAVEEANKANASKSAFLSNMSHEIRTPMNAIVGITDVMLRKEREEEDEKYLLSIKRSGAALLAIINDILDFSKIESGKMEIVNDTYDFNGMMEDLSLIFANRVGDKDVELQYEIDDSIPKYLWGDEVRVRQVIINLMNNAIKFTDHGFVRLTIKANEVGADKLRLQVAVADSGQGIKEEDLPKLFASFEQINTRKNHKKEGTGLGLAISKQIVTMMGGELQVESTYGVGTTFSFEIQQGIDCTKQDEQVKDVEEGTTSFAGAKILLVEDNEMNAQVAKLLLEPFEMEIDLAENGKVAVDMVQQKQYDLVFMDHMMPVMDGVEATQVIRALDGEEYQKLPIIALTANAISEAKAELTEAGMNDVATKPMEMDHIEEILKTWLK